MNDSPPPRRGPRPPVKRPTADRYRRIVAQIRQLMPEAAISADAIVGFPGETDAQFRRTLALVEEVGFDLLNTAA